MKNIPIFKFPARACNKTNSRRCKKVETLFGIDTGATTSFTSPKGIEFLEKKITEGVGVWYANNPERFEQCKSEPLARWYLKNGKK